MSKQKNKGDFKANSMAELQERGVLVVEIRASAAQVVLPLEPNLERDKAVDEGKFHDTYINSHFKIHDHTRSHAINFHSTFATKTVWPPFVV